MEAEVRRVGSRYEIRKHNPGKWKPCTKSHINKLLDAGYKITWNRTDYRLIPKWNNDRQSWETR